jgi:hypothetical protein
VVQFNIDVICVHGNSVGQELSDFGELRKITAGCPRAAYSITHMGEMKINEMATDGIFSLGGKFVWRRIRR